MTGRTHDLAAITALGVVTLTQPVGTMTLATALTAIFANLLGGVAPDIDQPTAPLWRNLPIGGIVGKGVDKLLGGHRFLTHSLLGVALFGVIAHYILVFLQPSIPHTDIHIVWLAFMIGMVSHLVMDSFTKEGVPWLLPVPIKFGFPPIKDLRLTTGKFAETIVIFPALAIFDSWYCAAHYNELLILFHHLVQ